DLLCDDDSCTEKVLQQACNDEDCLSWMRRTRLSFCRTRGSFRSKCSSEFLRILWAQFPADDPSVLSNMSLVYRLRDYNNGLVVQKPVQCHLTTALPILRGNLVHDLERSSTTLRNPSLPERTI